VPYSYSKISHLQVASGEGPHGCVTALIRSHYINMSPCSTNKRVGFTTHGIELPSLFRRPRQIGPWVDAPDGDRASLECRGNSSGGLSNHKLRLHIDPGHVLPTCLEGATGRDHQLQIVTIHSVIHAYGLTVLIRIPSRAWIIANSRVMARTAPWTND
jgi:hypothetical protein